MTTITPDSPTITAPAHPPWHTVLPDEEAHYQPTDPFADRDRVREQIRAGIATAETAGQRLADLRDALEQVTQPRLDAHFALTHIARYSIHDVVARGESVKVDDLGIPTVVANVVTPNAEKVREALAFMDAAAAAVERYRHNAEQDLATVEQEWEAEDAVPGVYELNLRRAYATALYRIERFERDSYLEPDQDMLDEAERWASALTSHKLAQSLKAAKA